VVVSEAMGIGMAGGGALGRSALGRIVNTKRQQPVSAMCLAKGSGKRYAYDYSSSRSNLGHVLPYIGPTIN